MHDLCQNKATDDKYKYTSLGKEYEDFSFMYKKLKKYM